MLVISGGRNDPSIVALAAAAKSLDTAHRCLWTGDAQRCVFDWDLQARRLLFNGEPLRMQSCFLRYDVFGDGHDTRPEVSARASAWFTALHGYAASVARIRLPNRRHLAALNKPVQLVWAMQAGLSVPQTWISNDVHAIQARSTQALIAKPINGGDYCRLLAEVLPETAHIDGGAAAPAIVQPRLVAPDIRVFQIGHAQMAFEIESQVLDYRTSSATRVKLLPHVPAGLAAPLAKLNRRMGLDFSAADFKADADSGELQFLEVNSSPMFAAFDHAAKGQLTQAMIGWLVG
jgi:hypothetical protein